MTEEGQPKKIGILYLHGAGLPEHQRALVGDPLATVVDGLLDHFQKDRFLRERYRITAKATRVKGRSTEELELSIYGKDETLPEWVIRMREVLWKPLSPKKSISTYLPLVWQWAFAFQSNLQRIKVLKEFLAQAQSAPSTPSPSATQKRTLEEISKARRRDRHNRQLLSRIALAGLGLLFTPLVWIAAEIYQRQSAIRIGINWLTPDQVVTIFFAVSIFAALLLVLLAVQEWFDNEADPPRPHNLLQLVSIALSTAWLSIFVLPVLLAVYYVDRLVRLGLELALAGAVIGVALNVGDWVMRVVLLGGIALAILVITIPSVWAFPDQKGALFRKNIQNVVVNQITTLLVTGAAPWVILLISVLEWLSFLPLIGNDLKRLAHSISNAGLWQAVKDIYVILTDSSRSAVVRHLVEEAIRELDQAHDLEAIHIFAHSLGTVVAYDTLVQIGCGNGIFINKRKAGEPYILYNKIKTLITFGSPLNKIRTLAHFQDGKVMSGFDYDRFGLSAHLPKDLGHDTFRWINVYTPHDFVSDPCLRYCEREDLVHPRDFTAWSADNIATAHGIYWSDKGFWNLALEVMETVYANRKPVRLEEMPDSKLRDGLLDLLGREIVQAQIKKDEIEKVRAALKRLGPTQLIEKLRDLGIVTETQFRAQVTQTPPVDMLRALGVVAKTQLEQPPARAVSALSPPR